MLARNSFFEGAIQLGFGRRHPLNPGRRHWKAPANRFTYQDDVPVGLNNALVRGPRAASYG